MKILILEDEHILRKLYVKALKGSGFEVFSAKNSAEAFDVMYETDIDLLIVDHGLRNSNLNGLKFVKLAKKFWQHTRVIMLTNFDHQALKKEAKEIGVYEFLLKLNMSPGSLADYLKGK